MPRKKKENTGPDLSDPIFQFRDVIPKSKEELDTYLRYYYDVYLAAKPIEPGNSSPLDFAWDIFSSMMNLKEKPTLEDYNFLGIACRSGQKSLTAGVIETLALTFDKIRDYFHMASIYDQSKVTYGYVQNFLYRDYLKDVAQKVTMGETISKFHKRLKIGTGTIKAVNSFHGSVIQDEADLTDRRVWTESKGMLSPQEGQSPLNIAISSRKFAFGNVQDIINQKQRNPNFPVKIHKWGQLEITQFCDDIRSGELGCEELYVDEDELVAVQEEDFEKLSTEARTKFSKYKSHQNCYECGLFSFCLGRLKDQVKDNPFLQNIDDVRMNFFRDPVEFFKSQRLNRKPSTSGLVYGMFDATKHFCSYEEMYKILTGEDWPVDTEPLTLESMIDIFHEYACRGFIGLDFGYNMAAALLGFVDGQDRTYILEEMEITQHSDAEIALALHERWGRHDIHRVFPDIASPGGIKELKKYFMVCDKDTRPYSTISKDVEWGVGIVRRQLRVPGTVNDSVMCIHNSCDNLGSEIVGYRYKIDSELDQPTDRIRKKDDHFCDALRYLTVGIFGIVIPKYTYFDRGSVSRPMVKTLPIPRDEHSIPTMPSISEIAFQIGRTDFIDNSDEFVKKDGEYKPKEGAITRKIVKFTIA